MSESMNLRVAREDSANNSTIEGRTAAAVVTKEKSIRNEMLFLLLPHCRCSQSRFP